jgi:hypothetical protein
MELFLTSCNKHKRKNQKKEIMTKKEKKQEKEWGKKTCRRRKIGERNR